MKDQAQAFKETLALLEVSVEELEKFLYHLSEDFEEKIGIPGLYSHRIFRNFWKRLTRNLTIAYMSRIRVTVQGDLCYSLSPRHPQIKGQANIREEYFRYMRSMLLAMPVNAAVLELIKTK